MKLDRKTIYRGRDIMNLTYELDLCDDGNVLLKRDRFLDIGKLLGVESQTCNEIPNKGWNMADSEMEGRKLCKPIVSLNIFQIKLLT